MRRVRSLRGRVALWMFAASSLSLVIFAIAAYVVVRIEETVERADPDVAFLTPAKAMRLPALALKIEAQLREMTGTVARD